MENPKAARLQMFIPGYRMHTHMFNNMLEGIREEDALIRIDGKTNHFVWMAGNVVNCRYWLAEVLGLSERDPFDALFKDARALDPDAEYPTLVQLKENWHRISPIVYRKLLSVDEVELSQSYPFGMGTDFVKENKLNMAGMCIDRESYLFGQMGLMRKLLDYPAVKYEIDESITY